MSVINVNEYHPLDDIYNGCSWMKFIHDYVGNNVSDGDDGRFWHLGQFF
jgi:hypothetical protein